MLKELKKLFVVKQNLGNYRGLLLLTGSFGALLVVLAGIVWPTWHKKQVLQQEMQLKQQKIKVLEGFAKKNAAYEERLAEVQLQQKHLRKQLPRSLDNRLLLTTLQNFAKQNNLLLSTTKMAEQQSIVEELQSLGVELKAKGGYLNCISFLERLENGSVTGVEQLQIEGDNSGILTLKGRFKMYALK